MAWGSDWEPSLRFLSPLIKPDVPVSGIRLSDWLHRRLTAGHSTASNEAHETHARKRLAYENRLVPRPATRCRRTRKSRTRS